MQTNQSSLTILLQVLCLEYVNVYCMISHQNIFRFKEMLCKYTSVLIVFFVVHDII